MTKEFLDAINAGKTSLVRIMIKDMLLLDRTSSFETVSEMEKVAAAYLKDLYDVHDGEELIKDKTLWTVDYMNSLMVEVVNNFSHERLDYLKNVVSYLRTNKKL